jgi:hypothetical protein
MSDLRQLSKSQFDAALAAAHALMHGNPGDANDRATFREKKARLAELLPDSAAATAIVSAAVRWDLRNSLAASLEMDVCQ